MCSGGGERYGALGLVAWQLGRPTSTQRSTIQCHRRAMRARRHGRPEQHRLEGDVRTLGQDDVCPLPTIALPGPTKGVDGSSAGGVSFTPVCALRQCQARHRPDIDIRRTVPAIAVLVRVGPVSTRRGGPRRRSGSGSDHFKEPKSLSFYSLKHFLHLSFFLSC